MNFEMACFIVHQQFLSWNPGEPICLMRERAESARFLYTRDDAALLDVASLRTRRTSETVV